MSGGEIIGRKVMENLHIISDITSDLGLDLIDHHLMKKTYSQNIANYPVKAEKDGMVEKVKYIDGEGGKSL